MRRVGERGECARWRARPCAHSHLGHTPLSKRAPNDCHMYRFVNHVFRLRIETSAPRCARFEPWARECNQCGRAAVANVALTCVHIELTKASKKMNRQPRAKSSGAGTPFGAPAAGAQSGTSGQQLRRRGSSRLPAPPRRANRLDDLFHDAAAGSSGFSSVGSHCAPSKRTDRSRPASPHSASSSPSRYSGCNNPSRIPWPQGRGSGSPARSEDLRRVATEGTDEDSQQLNGVRKLDRNFTFSLPLPPVRYPAPCTPCPQAVWLLQLQAPPTCKTCKLDRREWTQPTQVQHARLRATNRAVPVLPQIQEVQRRM